MPAPCHGCLPPSSRWHWAACEHRSDFTLRRDPQRGYISAERAHHASVFGNSTYINDTTQQNLLNLHPIMAQPRRRGRDQAQPAPPVGGFPAWTPRLVHLLGFRVHSSSGAFWAWVPPPDFPCPTSLPVSVCWLDCPSDWIWVFLTWGWVGLGFLGVNPFLGGSLAPVSAIRGL